MGLLRALYRRALGSIGSDSDPGALGERDIAAVFARVLGHRLRGALLAPRLKGCGGALYVGRRARVLNPWHVTVGRGVKLEEDAEVQGLSRGGVHLGDRVTVGRSASIRPSSYYGHDPGEGLTVGAGTAIGAFSWIGASGRVEIGRDVLLGPRVVILPENHVFADVDATIRSQGVERLGVVIEDDCWLGANATILAGVRVGRGSIVAAGAVVTRDVPPFTIVGGVPARVLRRRRPDDAPADAPGDASRDAAAGLASDRANGETHRDAAGGDPVAWDLRESA